MAHHLFDLPPEVLHRILANTDPTDLGKLCCCHALNNFVNGDRLLWREVYLSHFDDPRFKRNRKTSQEEPSWKAELQKLVRFQKILESKDIDLKERHLDGIAESIDFLLKSGEGLAGLDSSQNLAFLNGVFRDNPRNIKTILCGSSLFQWASSHASSQAPQCTVHTEPPVSRDAKADVVHDEPNSLSHVFIGHGEPSTTDLDTPPPVATNPLHSYRQQLCAKMHCLYGVPIDDVVRDTASSSHYNLRYNSIAIHPYVRSRVYDLRQHTDGSLWGPFTDDGALEVDWEKLESIMIILNHNMKRYSTRYSEPGHDVPPWNEGFVGANPYSYFPELLDPSREPRAPLDSQDPYNVTGTWMRVVCFLDYTELYAFNFPEDQPPSHQPRPPLNTEEATRLINMKIKVTKIGPPGEDDGQDLPVVYFKGISSSLKPSWDANSNSSIRGTVRLTPKGEVRWTTMSVIHGEQRWRSEGIQIGGVQSSRGVLGYWFDKDYDMYGPAGPTAFWKMRDGIDEKESSD